MGRKLIAPQSAAYVVLCQTMADDGDMRCWC